MRGMFKVHLLIAFIFSVAGCGSSGRGAPTPGQDAAPDVTAATGMTWSGSVYEGLIGPDGGAVPIEDAKVCIVGHPEIACATTGADGTYTMMLPPVDAAARWAANFTAPGHIGATVALDGGGPGSLGLKPDDWAMTISTQAGFAYPSNGTATIRLRVTNGGSQGVAGATATLSQASGVGPIYANESGDPDPTLTSTSSSGILLFGNVTPGLFTIAIGAHGLTCDCCDQGRLTGWEWTGSDPGTLVAVTAADSLTDNLYMQCY